MKYQMEELIPIVARLTEQYTSFESTSVTYEKAEQLMRAVLYCIHETETGGSGGMISAEGIPAEQAYQAGLALAEEKVKKALELYHELLPEFVDYRNQCLYDTVVKGLPEFFKWYDVKFEPQNTIVMLDYPVLKDLSGYSGIDKIYEFICCIRAEQEFLGLFPEQWVIHVLSNQNPEYGDMIENLCETVLTAVLCHMVLGKPLQEDLDEGDAIRLQSLFEGMPAEKIQEQFCKALEQLLAKMSGNTGSLPEYFNKALHEIAVRVKHAARKSTPVYMEYFSG